MVTLPHEPQIVQRVMMEPDPVKGAPYFVERRYTAKLFTIAEPHCQQCGSTSPEYISNTYSGCCNERVIVHGTFGRRCDPAECSHDVDI
jgi:hypothetical protein